MSKKHKDVEFAVDDPSGRQIIFKTFDEATGAAVRFAASRGQTVNLDVLVSSKSGARAMGGDQGVEMYMEDPDASVFERIEISANYVGRIP